MSRKADRRRLPEELRGPRRVGVFEAKTHLSDLLDEVEETGATIVITRHGKEIAELRRPNGKDPAAVRAALAAIKAIGAGATLGGISIREIIDEGRR